MLSRSKLSAAVAATVVWLASGIVSAGQDPRPTFRAAVSRVSLNVVVRDERGRAIKDLAGSDFQVFDQGRAVQISEFRSGEEPVSVAILVDTSGSMGIGARLATAKQALDLLLAQFRSGDESALFTFDRTLREVVPFSTDGASVRDGFNRVKPFGSTSLHDAVAAAARRLSARPSGRHAVVAITDGFDNSSQLSAAAASASRVPATSLCMYSRSRTPRCQLMPAKSRSSRWRVGASLDSMNSPPGRAGRRLRRKRLQRPVKPPARSSATSAPVTSSASRRTMRPAGINSRFVSPARTPAYAPARDSGWARQRRCAASPNFGAQRVALVARVPTDGLVSRADDPVVHRPIEP